MSRPEGKIPSFQQHLESVHRATPNDYPIQPEEAVPDDTSSFEQMKDYILRRGEGVSVAHTFSDDNGQIYDCMPIEQQPSLKGAHPARPQNLPVLPTNRPNSIRSVQPQLAINRSDQFGNLMRCPAGTVPVRRIKLAEVTRFQSLRSFLQKTPSGRGRHPRLSAPELSSNAHKYACAFQTVRNLGGHSSISIWDPSVGSQIFSLAQHWYSGGSPLQTVECGWQVWPQKWQTPAPVLFIYWTADDYGSTGGYNLECSGFVQTNGNWALGSALNTVSSAGGNQFELEVAWHLVGGNWWLYLNGTDSTDAVGYYPTSIFDGGQMGAFATDIDYGGETVNQTSWPPMGSGGFANLGYGQAAYQRDIYYVDSNGTAQPAGLAPSQSSPNCYTVILGNAASPWNAHFFLEDPADLIVRQCCRSNALRIAVA